MNAESRYPYDIESSVDNAGASIIQIDRSSAMLGVVAMAIAALAFGGVIVGSIVMPQLMEARAKAEAAQGDVNFRLAERETRLLREDVRQIQTQLAEQGIKIQLNSH